MVEAITALRNCALCSASDSGAYVVATAMAYLPVIAPFSRAVRYQTAALRDDTSGRDGWLYRREAQIVSDPRLFAPKKAADSPGLFAGFARRHDGYRRLAVVGRKHPLQIVDLR